MKLNLDKSGWKKVRLGDVATAPSIRINNPSESGFDRFIGNANIGQWDFRLTSWESTDSVTSAMKGFGMGDYLFVRRSLYASDFRERSPRATFAGVCSGDIITIRENPEKIADGFLIGVLNSPEIWKYVVANASGSITRRIKWRDLANYEFLLPPKDQQAKLAELLWTADAAVTSIKELIERVTRAKACHFADRIGRASIDGIWPIRKIRDFAKIVRGSSPRPAGSRELFDGDFLPWVTVGLLTNKTNPYLEEHEVASYLTEKGATQTRIIPADTVILSNSGFSLGVPSILTFEAGANDGIAAFLELQGLDREYLYYYLASLTSYLREQIAAGADQPNLNTSRIGNLSIPVPDLETQNEIAAEMLAFDTTVNQASETLKAQQGMLRSLINQIF